MRQDGTTSSNREQAKIVGSRDDVQPLRAYFSAMERVPTFQPQSRSHEGPSQLQLDKEGEISEEED